MKALVFAVWCFVLVTGAGAADSARQPYVSRYEQWMPHVSNTLVVTVSVGGGPSGLWSGSFSAHPFPREPDAVRSDGTPVTAHALVTTDEMKAILKLIDGIGASATFTTCNDDNWREPDGEPTRLQVVWRPDEKGHRYDWYVVSQIQMRDHLKNLLASVRSREARLVIEGLIEGCKTGQNSEKQGANQSSEGTR